MRKGSEQQASSWSITSWLLAPSTRVCERALSDAVRGKVVLVTGASFGIGRALALRLGRASANLVLVARTEESLQELAAQIEAEGGRARALVVDLSSPDSVLAACARWRDEGVVFDLVVHNAGKSIRRLLVDSLDRFHDFRRTMAVNYLGPVQLQLALLPAMIAKGGGQIVNVSSLGVRLPPAPRWSAYTASKSAFDTWLRAASPELRLHGIACTSIYLGLVHTRMSAPTDVYRGMPGLTDDEAARVICRAIVRRPRKIEPWWLAPVRWVGPSCEGLVDLGWRMLLRRSRATVAGARGSS